MSTRTPSKANILGDLRAEFDQKMLDAAFYDSPDYRSLLESADRTVIVGRRGAGKSALFLRLKKHWGDSSHTKVITIAPEDYETISLQGVLAPFKSRINLVRAAAKLGWRYALIMEIGRALQTHFKFSQISGVNNLLASLRLWNQTSGSVTANMRHTIEPYLERPTPPEALVGDLASHLDLTMEAHL